MSEVIDEYKLDEVSLKGNAIFWLCRHQFRMKFREREKFHMMLAGLVVTFAVLVIFIPFAPAKVTLIWLFTIAFVGMAALRYLQSNVGDIFKVLKLRKNDLLLAPLDGFDFCEAMMGYALYCQTPVMEESRDKRTLAASVAAIGFLLLLTLYCMITASASIWVLLLCYMALPTLIMRTVRQEGSEESAFAATYTNVCIRWLAMSGKTVLPSTYGMDYRTLNYYNAMQQAQEDQGQVGVAWMATNFIVILLLFLASQIFTGAIGFSGPAFIFFAFLAILLGLSGARFRPSPTVGFDLQNIPVLETDVTLVARVWDDILERTRGDRKKVFVKIDPDEKWVK